ncbi:type II secretion system protein GspL [Parasphingorhabdus sp. JC815]|uniref:type II secretion system protein GspL n=1 Tax=Parasphingorhabdus sp. JC815 TaxID=3232140 RepID=UPI0034579B50
MSRFFITVFPTTENQVLQWWLVDSDEAVLEAKGSDVDPLLAAGLQRLSGESEKAENGGSDTGVPEKEPLVMIALMPSARGVVRWHDPMDGLTEQQILAAARLAARERSLDGENVHIAATMDGSGGAVTATVGKDVMASGLLKLKALGIDPDAVVPAGWLITPREDVVIEADFGFEKLLRGKRMIVPDEPDLRAHLIGDSAVIALPQAVDEALANLGTHEAEKLSLNLRCGDFAKKIRRSMTLRQKRILGWMALAALVISLLIPIIQLVKYHRAASAADEAALAIARPLTGPVESAEEADRLLSERFIGENRGNIIFSVPTSALFSAVQKAEGVVIEKISYRRDGMVSAALGAVRAGDINQVVTALRNAGFIITSTARTDAAGASKADIMVRAP